MRGSSSETKSSDEFSLEAHVNVGAFASASASHSETTENGQKEAEENTSSMTDIRFVGEPPNPETNVIPPAKSPGVISFNIRPICPLLNPNSDEKGVIVQQYCSMFVRSKKFCFTQFPLEADDNENYENIVQHFFAMKTYLQCSEIGNPFVGMKMIPIAWKMHLFRRKPEISNQRECAFACLDDKNCGAWSFSSTDRCVVCEAKRVKRESILMFYERSTIYRRQCIARYWDVVRGVNARFVEQPVTNTETNATEIFFNCMVDVPKQRFFDHCFESMAPCRDGESCVGLSFVHERRPVFQTEFHAEHSPIYGLPIHYLTQIFGVPTSPSLSVDVDITQTEAERICQYMDNTVFGTGRGHRGSDIIDKITLKIAQSCLENVCAYRDKCDTVVTKIDFPVSQCNNYRKNMLKELFEVGESERGTGGTGFREVHVRRSSQTSDRSINSAPPNKTREVSRQAFEFWLGKRDNDLNTNFSDITDAGGILLTNLGNKISASCEFFTGDDIVLMNLRRKECKTFPGLCDLKIGTMVHRDSLI